jgi:hypothetical protein
MGASSGFGSMPTLALPIVPEHGSIGVKCGSGATIGTDLAIIDPQRSGDFEAEREPDNKSPGLAPVWQIVQEDSET